MGRAAKERRDVKRAVMKVEDLEEKLAELQEAFDEEAARIAERMSGPELVLKTLTLSPRKADIEIEELALAWVPWRETAGGGLERATLT